MLADPPPIFEHTVQPQLSGPRLPGTLIILDTRKYTLNRYHKRGEKCTCRHFSHLDISLIRYGSYQPIDKLIQIIEVALYMKTNAYNTAKLFTINFSCMHVKGRHSLY